MMIIGIVYCIVPVKLGEKNVKEVNRQNTPIAKKNKAIDKLSK